MSSAARSTTFDVVLYPNQPPNRKVFSTLLWGVAVVLGIAGIGFTAAGAWPVSGFLGLDLLLLIVAFRWARREAARREHIRLDQTGLHVCCVEPCGVERRWRFEPHWVRVAMDEPPRPGSRLTLQERGRTLTLGRFLTPGERLDLAKALRAALQHYGR